MNMNQIVYGAGAVCSGIALYAKGTQVAGLTAAAVSFAVPVSILKGYNQILNQVLASSKKSKKDESEKVINKTSFKVVNLILAKVAVGVLSYHAVRGLCPQLSIQRALVVTGLGVVSVGFDKLPTIHKNLSIYVNEIVTAGVVLAAASGLKALGYIK